MKRTSVIVIAVLSLLLGTTALAYAQRDDQQGDKPKQEQQGDQKDDKSGKSGSGDRQDRRGRQDGQNKQATQAKPEKAQRGQEAKPQQAPQTRDQQQQQPQNQNKQQEQQRVQQQQQQDRSRQQQQAARLPQERQRQMVDQQQQRLTQYRQHLDQQERVLQQQTAQLQQEKRAAQYRSSQDYLGRLRQQRVFLNDHHPDYDRDPFFFTVSIYGYNRGGRHYEINQYGADLLRQAVNFGYEEGFRAGQADREDHWRFSYEDSYAYQDANYGYNGYYVDRDDYNYYFREGFRRGYDDGFYSRSQYGRYTDRSYTINDSVLTVVLNFQSLR
jgi:hypothetical protein